ncbi:hypothetical protein MSIMFI_04506 [Mycobacterium simulans]|uniref:hypothetical protein n=1 Tax=Mycobacterium simulans TaxID=627089 RepID=UPI0019C39F7F|nr:hypothetical protein MSIMFI_04506 [Mycobacterium simulans]
MRFESGLWHRLLRHYLGRWYWQVKGYVGGLTPQASDDELRAAAPLIPVLCARELRA